MARPICGISQASKQHALPEMPDSLCLNVHDGNLPRYIICVVVVGDQLLLHHDSPTSDTILFYTEVISILFKITLPSFTNLVILQASYNFLTKGFLAKQSYVPFSIQSFSLKLLGVGIAPRSPTSDTILSIPKFFLFCFFTK